jgi:hypothetical protein
VTEIINEHKVTDSVRALQRSLGDLSFREEFERQFLKFMQDYRRVHCPELVYEPGMRHKHIVYNHRMKKYVVELDTLNESPGIVYLPDHMAQYLVKQLNTGKIVIPYQPYDIKLEKDDE